MIFTIGILIVCLAFIAAAIWWQYRSLACPASLIWLIENPYMNASAGLTDILVEKGLISKDDLSKALDLQQNEKTFLGQVLVDQGLVGESDLFFF